MSDDCHSPESASSGQSQSLDEFGLIQRFFVDQNYYSNVWPFQGIGDDCAILELGCTRLAVTTDMMALGTHFLEDADPFTVGQKALAVNLSDLAASGATPKAFFLSLSLPAVDVSWLDSFSKGLLKEAATYNCPLRGGDTTKTASVDGKPGKTCFSICAIGEISSGPAMTRAGARAGDDIWVSGTPGDAFAYLGDIWKEFTVPSRLLPYFKARMETPTPRVQLGTQIRHCASACCDISDGLVGDLKHILERSNVSAVLYWGDFPRSEQMSLLPELVQQRCVLAGGDDYELLFTAPKSVRDSVKEIGKSVGVKVTRIGEILPPGIPLRILTKEGQSLPVMNSFNHFE